MFHSNIQSILWKIGNIEHFECELNWYAFLASQIFYSLSVYIKKAHCSKLSIMKTECWLYLYAKLGYKKKRVPDWIGKENRKNVSRNHAVCAVNKNNKLTS